MSNLCPVEGCVKDVFRGGYCYGHYMKNWRYGTPTPKHKPRWKDLSGKRFGTLVAVERLNGKWRCECDCGGERFVSVGDLNRYGDRNTCGVEGKHFSEFAGYGAVHDRIRRYRGRADSNQCFDCGDVARQWSYDHECPRERVQEVAGYMVSYSPDMRRYVPRCVSCHKLFDLGRNDTASVIT